MSAGFRIEEIKTRIRMCKQASNRAPLVIVRSEVGARVLLLAARETGVLAGGQGSEVYVLDSSWKSQRIRS